MVGQWTFSLKLGAFRKKRLRLLVVVVTLTLLLMLLLFNSAERKKKQVWCNVWCNNQRCQTHAQFLALPYIKKAQASCSGCVNTSFFFKKILFWFLSLFQVHKFPTCGCVRSLTCLWPGWPWTSTWRTASGPSTSRPARPIWQAWSTRRSSRETTSYSGGVRTKSITKASCNCAYSKTQHEGNMDIIFSPIKLLKTLMTKKKKTQEASQEVMACCI